MKKIEILRIESLSRAPLVIEGYLFEGIDPKAPSLAVVGAMDGDAILPLFCASHMVDYLKNTIGSEKIKGNILIIPSINHYALNIAQRFWPLDKTDLNMMFPGYSEGETTQRIAAKVFEAISGYTYGINLERRRDPSSCLPHIKLFKSGYEDIVGAKKFGFKIIHHSELRSIDTVTLQYNWQLWWTKAYSIVCPVDNLVDKNISSQIHQAMVRFMDTKKSGIFIPREIVGSYVVKGQIIGQIIHSLNGEVVNEIKATSDGMIICCFNNSLILENAVAFRIAKLR
ncbi:MAG: succinylglutamate desuccinylase/aspartoacylase family protein [Arcobacter sp.]|nr:succinylglutamate desuccinylase/aspartoacylase family protein [Arcobacter sp.]